MLKTIFVLNCMQVFKNPACMMHMGNMTKDFVPVGKEEQAEIKDETNSHKVAELLGIDGMPLSTCCFKQKHISTFSTQLSG